MKHLHEEIARWRKLFEDESLAKSMAVQRAVTAESDANANRLKFEAAERELAETRAKLETAELSRRQSSAAWLSACAKLEALRDVVKLAWAAGSIPSLVLAQFSQILDPQTDLSALVCTPAERAVLDAMAAIPLLALRRWTARCFGTVMGLARAELARRGENL